MRVLALVLLGLVALAMPAMAETRPGYLGVEMRDLTAEEAPALGFDEPTGVWVMKLVPGGPAEQAGLQPGDVILSVDGVEVAGSAAFREAVGAKPAGTETRFRLIRDGRNTTVRVILAERPAEPKPPNPLHLMIDTGGHRALVRALAWTPDGRQIVTAGEDKVIRVWDVASGRTVRTIHGEVGPDAGQIYALALSPDGRWLAVGGLLAEFDGSNHADVGVVRLYDFATGRLVRLLKGHREVVLALAFSPDGKRLVSGSADRTAIVWDVAAGTALQRLGLGRLEYHADAIYGVGFALDGRRVVTGSLDAKLKLWDVETATLARTLTGHADSVMTLTVSPDGRRIASGDRAGDIRLWDAATGELIRILDSLSGGIKDLAWSPDGTRIMIVSGSVAGSSILTILSALSGEILAQHLDHDNSALAAGWHPDSISVATAGGNANTIHIWPAAAAGKPPTAPIAAKALQAGGGRSNWATGFAADGSAIAWGTRLIPNELETGFVAPLEFFLRLPAVNGDFGSPARLSSGDKEVGQGAGSGAPAFLHATKTHGAFTLRHAQGGDYGDVNAILEVLEADAVVARLQRGPVDGLKHRSYSFTPDGRTIVSGGSSGVLHTFDLATTLAAAMDMPRRFLEGPAFAAVARRLVGHEGSVSAVTPSPDGRLLVTGSDDQTVRLWNLATGELIVSLLHLPDTSDWLMWTPQGYFTGSPGADSLIGWQVNRGADQTPDYFEASRLRRQFEREDIVADAIRLASAEEAIRQARGTGFKLEDLLQRPPPRLSLLSPADGATLTGGEAVLQIRLDPTPDPAKRLTLRVDGRAITEITPDSLGGEITLKAPLTEGLNIVTLVAENEVGETPIEIRLTHQGPGALDKRGTLFVVSIGIDRYPGLGDNCGTDGKQSCDLNFAGLDAWLFAEGMRHSLGAAHEKVDVTLLTGSGEPGDVLPTAAAIRSALSRVRNLATETDTVVLFTAGHGDNDGSDYLLLATDARRQGRGFDGNTVVPWVELERLLFGARGRRFMFVDTCRSAGAYRAKLGHEAYHNDVTVIAASGQDEVSVELSKLGHGLFTYTIAEALGDKASVADADQDGQVKVSELGAFLRARTAALIDTHWPTFEADANVRRPVPRVFRARDAADHVLATLP